MTPLVTIVVVVGLLLVGLGIVASQLFRLKDWLKKAPPPPQHPDSPDDPDR
ncbi:hypothetical protein ACXDF8_01095 [Mycolicibacterium sp. CBM1]